jgi:hypothetical protein
MGNFDDMRKLFLNLGMSEEAAQIAAVGRHGSEAEARAAAESAEVDTSNPEALAAALRAEHDVTRHLTPAERQVVEAATAHLGYSREAAADMAKRLHYRETDKGGFDHAEGFLSRFAAGLRGEARVAA